MYSRAKMKADTPLDYAVFQLSPKRSRCELLVSSNGNTEKLASGLLKPFVTHLKVAEEQVAQAVHSIKLEVEKHRNADTWFTRGTLERFVRFVSTPEVLEMVNTFDAEMSQLEAARTIYSQGAGDQHFGASGGDGTGTVAGADATKKELLRAIDVRLAAVRQDLIAAYARGSAAGFNPDTVLELQLFADCFGAHRLNESCTKFISLCQRRPDLINPGNPGVDDQVVRSSWGSDMSIDDPTEDSSGSYNVSTQSHQPLQHLLAGQEQRQPYSAQSQHYHNQSKPSTCELQNSSPTQPQIIRKENKEEEKKKEDVTESSPGQPIQPARRLSVQDRINLFENKQKENSGGKPVVVGKPAELRRLSSDVSSAPVLEKTVLRRWSGASDMSIDLGNDKKDNNSADSPLCTSSSSSLSQTKSYVLPSSSADNKDQKGLNDTVSSVEVDAKSVFGLKDHSELQTCRFVGRDEEAGLGGKANWKDQVGSQDELRSYTGREEQVGVANQGFREEKLKCTSVGEERGGGVEDQLGFERKPRGLSDRVDTIAAKKHAGFRSQIGSSVGRVGDVDSGNAPEDVEREQPLSQARFRGSQTRSQSLSGQLEGGFGAKVKEVLCKETEGNQEAPQPQWGSFSGEVEQVGKDTVSSGKEPTKVEALEGPRMKVQMPVSAGPDQIRKLQGRKDESGSVYGSNRLVIPNKRVSESRERFGYNQASLVEQVQKVRQSKGNQELNDDLKMKANELEKLFAEHKLRVPGDQSGSTRRSKPTDVQGEQAVSSQNRKSVAAEISPAEFQDKKPVLEQVGNTSENIEFSTPPPMKAGYHQDNGNSLRRNFSELSVSDESRGKFYETYMQKRDAKLREEWVTKRADKEAKLKAMHDSLEQSRAELKTKFSGSSLRQDSVSSARRRAEKLRSFNFRLSIKREQHQVDSIQSEEDEYLSEFPEHKCYGQARSLNEASFGDGASRSSQSKKILPNRNMSSSTPRNATAPVPRSLGKISNPSSGRRRAQSENHLAQSVPNFSDFKKENTKPSSGISKIANRSQVRTYSRSKGTSEEMLLAKEEKPRRLLSLRKSSATPVEFKGLSPSDSDDVVLAPLKFDREQTERGLHDKLPKNVESRPFLRKGNGIGPGAGASIAKLKASVAAEMLENEEEFEESPFEAEDSGEVTKGEDVELETTEVEDYANMDNGKLRLSHESDKMAISGSENGDSLRSLSQIDPISVAELPASVPSTFHVDGVGSLQDSPGESPVSWNSRMHHPFSYPHENSDIDASVDSPIGSPASWNSQSITQAEADAARMRKKWGSAQRPILVANSSHNQSRKDVTKGFKRLLKFGRKSRGTESLVDWISATTSDGDDDTEDVRDPTYRSSEDLRKSRMGFSQGNPSDDGFNESELFNDQAALHSAIPAPPANFRLRDDHISGSSIKAPRSFFSLSSFRSKGSDPKHR